MVSATELGADVDRVVAIAQAELSHDERVELLERLLERYVDDVGDEAPTDGVACAPTDRQIQSLIDGLLLEINSREHRCTQT